MRIAQTIVTCVLGLSRTAKAALLLAVDALLIPASLAIALALLGADRGLPELLLQLPFVIAAGLLGAWALGLPQTRLQDYEASATARTALLALGLSAASALAFEKDLPGGVHAVFAMTYFVAAFLGRIAMREALVALYRAAQSAAPVIIYGAGRTGMRIAAALRGDNAIRPVAFVDDNAALHGLKLSGLRVHSSLGLEKIAARSGARRVILAMPSLPHARRREIARRIRAAGLEAQALPPFAQILDDELGLDRLRPVDPRDFLEREHRAGDGRLLAESYEGRSVLVSGAGGSIGSELCRQILACRPRRLVLVELNEHPLFQIERELHAALGAEPSATEIVTVLGSITDPRLVRGAIRANGVEVVLHAAAYKHVPLVERNAVSGLANNVLGTHVLAREALAAGVERFILVSSDKAVAPASVMGASKRIAELVVQDLAARSGSTCFAAVRFGNVLGSSGSVVPVFREQIAAGGPVTLTDPDATRYFMTVEEAVHLVLVAGAHAAGGEIFVLDMGEPMRIADLARKMIAAAGYTVRDAANPDGDIEIRLIGLRAGERRHEAKMTDGAQPSGAHPAILKVEAPALSELEIAAVVRGIRGAVSSGDPAEARRIVERFLADYRSSPEDGRVAARL